MNRAIWSSGPCRATRPWVTFALASLALGPLSACVRKPSITLHHAEVRAASAYGLGMDVFLVIENTNSYNIEVRAIRATVLLAGRYPVPIQFAPNPPIPLFSGRSIVVPVPVTVPWAAVPGIVASSVGSTTVPYTVRGNADVTAFGVIDRNNYPIDEEGTVPRQFFVNATQSVLPIRF
jgi:late embryogenesis abundant protein